MVEIFALILAATTIGWMVYIVKHDATTWRKEKVEGKD